MRNNFLLFWVLLFFAVQGYSQKNMQGYYQDYFGYSLYINEDSTFLIEYHFHLFSNWATGKWTINKDTINLNVIPVYDTFKLVEKDRILSEKIVLSDDKHAESILLQPFYDTILLRNIDGVFENKIFTVYPVQSTTSFGGQSDFSFPNKLFYKRKRLYILLNGKLNRKKDRASWTSEKHPHYFYRIAASAE